MNKKLTSSFLMLLVLLIISSKIASAHHLRWMIKDSRFQNINTGLRANFIPWWFHTGMVTTFSIAPGTTISTDIRNAVASWNSQIPNVKLIEISSGGDIIIKQQNRATLDVTCSLGAAGCEVNDSYYNSVTDNSFYVLKSSIYIEDSYTELTLILQ